MIPKLHLPSPNRIANKVKDVVSPRGDDGKRHNLIKGSVLRVFESGRHAFRAANPPTVLRIIETTESVTTETLDSIRKDFEKAYVKFEQQLDRADVIRSNTLFYRSELYKINQRSSDVGVKPQPGEDTAHLAGYWTASDFEDMDSEAVFGFLGGCFRALHWSGTDLLPDDKAGAKVMLNNALTVLDNMGAAHMELTNRKFSYGSVRFRPDRSMAKPLHEMRAKCREYLKRLDRIDPSDPSDKSIGLEAESSSTFSV